MTASFKDRDGLPFIVQTSRNSPHLLIGGLIFSSSAGRMIAAEILRLADEVDVSQGFFPVQTAVKEAERLHPFTTHHESSDRKVKAGDQVCNKCDRIRPPYLNDPTCPGGGYCDWSEV